MPAVEPVPETPESEPEEELELAVEPEEVLPLVKTWAAWVWKTRSN